MVLPIDRDKLEALLKPDEAAVPVLSLPLCVDCTLELSSILHYLATGYSWKSQGLGIHIDHYSSMFNISQSDPSQFDLEDADASSTHLEAPAGPAETSESVLNQTVATEGGWEGCHSLHVKREAKQPR